MEVIYNSIFAFHLDSSSAWIYCGKEHDTVRLEKINFLHRVMETE